MTKFLVISALLALLQLTTSEVIVGSNVRLALKTRAEAEATLRWCYVFYQEDFPEESICSGATNGFWDHFSTCCNGAYSCRDNTIYKTFLCPAESIYDESVGDCVPFVGDVCPNRAKPNEPPTELPNEPPVAPVVNCGMTVDGRIPHPSDCTKYIDCKSTEPTVCDCLENYVYYRPFKVCLPGDKETCLLHGAS